MPVMNHVPYEEEKRKNPELTDTDVRSLKEWMKKQPHLPQLDDNEIALFLHVNYYRIESTKNTIENYCTIRSHVPEFFAGRDPMAEDFKRITQCMAYIPLKQLTKEGYQVWYSCFLSNDASKFDFPSNLKLASMLGDLHIRDSGTVKGHIMVAEIKGLSMGHLTSMNPIAMKKFALYIQEAAPLRLKGLHHLSVNPVVDIVMNMARPFLKKEIQDLMHFHKSTKTLEKFIDIDILPEESGGKAGKAKDLFDEVVKKAEANRQWYVDLERTIKVDESKRSGPAKTSGELFGVEGSFKKLDFD